MVKRKKPKTTKKKSSQKDLKKAQQTFILGAILVLISVVYFFQKTYNNHVFERNLHTYLVTQTERKEVLEKVSIPSLKIDLPIKEGYILNGFWGVNEKGASHLANSGNPGGKETIIIYGHNTTKIFGLLPYIKKGQKIVLTTKEGNFTYIVKEIEIVKPDNTKALSFGEKNQELVLYTCTGFADSKRLIVKALPEAPKIKTLDLQKTSE